EVCSFFFSSRRRHTRSKRDWSSDVCSSDLTESGFLDVLETASASAQSVERLLLVDDRADEYGDLVDELAAEETDFTFTPSDRIRPDDLLTLIYTSGTTGPQKGVELTHRGMLTQLRGVHAAVPLPG